MKVSIKKLFRETASSQGADYSAPESKENDTPFDKTQADVFSLGMMLLSVHLAWDNLWKKTPELFPADTQRYLDNLKKTVQPTISYYISQRPTIDAIKSNLFLFNKESDNRVPDEGSNLDGVKKDLLSYMTNSKMDTPEKRLLFFIKLTSGILDAYREFNNSEGYEFGVIHLKNIIINWQQYNDIEGMKVSIKKLFIETASSQGADYSAPESKENDPPFDKTQADVFSLGMMLLSVHLAWDNLWKKTPELFPADTQRYLDNLKKTVQPTINYCITQRPTIDAIKSNLFFSNKKSANGSEKNNLVSWIKNYFTR